LEGNVMCIAFELGTFYFLYIELKL